MALSEMNQYHDVFSAVARFLSDDQDFEQATRVAQIFSAICFGGLGFWLAFTNGTKLSYVQRASLEKRLEVCCLINCYVAIFSAFFNAFQLTEVDNIILPRGKSFVLDLARPIEWIATCPLMQLVLVLMGGSRIPEYRLVLMPSLSVIVVLWGIASTLVESWPRYICYVIGCFFAIGMFSLNRQQIIEHSNGAEGLFRGESEFRKASALIIATWFPFPIWFVLSPEGLSIIDNTLVIQMGWAMLNIVAKFTVIFYIQRVKDNYCNRLKVRREMNGTNFDVDIEGGTRNGNSIMPSSQKNPDKEKNELAAVVVETMNFLAMSQHAERFLRLLHKAKVTTLEDIEHLNRQRALDLQLPWDLVHAVQRRLRVWRMEMQDTAEQELDKGETHYKDMMGDFADGSPAYDPLKSGGMMVDEEVKQQLSQLSMLPDMLQRIEQKLGDSKTGNGGGDGLQAEVRDFSRSLEGKIDDQRTQVMRSIEELRMAQVRQMVDIENKLKDEAEGRKQAEGAAKDQKTSNSDENEKIQTAITRMSHSMESWMIEVSQLQQQLHISRKADSQATQVMQNLQSSVDTLSSSFDDKLVTVSKSQVQKIEGIMQQSAVHMQSLKREQDEVDSKVVKLVGKTMEDVEFIKHSMHSNLTQQSNSMASEASQGTQAVQAIQQLQASFDELPRTVEQKLKALNIKKDMQDVADRVDKSVGDFKGFMQSDLDNITSANALASSNMMDVRRLCMMVLEQATGAHERSQGNGAKLQELHGLLEGNHDRLLKVMTNPNSAQTPTMPTGSLSQSLWDRQPSSTLPQRPVTASSVGRQIMKNNTGNNFAA